jgi:hypothetical protein
MSGATLSRSVFPVLGRAVRGLLLALVVLAPLILGLLAIETSPRVPVAGASDAAAASRTRDVAAGLRDLFDDDGAAGTWSTREDELNAVFAAARRIAPGILAAAEVGDATLRLRVSAGAPHLPDGLWANLEMALAPSEDGLHVVAARIGRLGVPPALALGGLSLALDRALGDGLGTAAIDSVAGLRLAPPVVTVAFVVDEGGRVAFFDRLRARAREATGTAARERVYAQLARLHKGVERRRLPRNGSMLPYVRQVLRVAARSPAATDRDEARAALYALALYCGDPDFGQAISVTLPDRMDGTGNGCQGTSLAGRDDLKRHFVIAAGLYAATTGKAAFGMGELKELLDSDDGGSGFSFDDLAADAAGLRFAEAFLATPRAGWPALLARLESEADILPPLDGLPTGLSDTEFRDRYGDVDSPAYAGLVAEIRGRVEALPLYRATVPGSG